MTKFDAIILSGGKGTRVKKYTKKIPKCLVDVNGQPFLYHQLKYLKKNNLKKIIISNGYLGKKVEKYLQQNIDFIHTKTIHDGIKPLGTGGATLKALNYQSLISLQMIDIKVNFGTKLNQNQILLYLKVGVLEQELRIAQK